MYAYDTEKKSMIIYPWKGQQARMFAISDHEVLMTLRGNQTYGLIMRLNLTRLLILNKASATG
jgi:hypothetical protein